MAYPISKLWLYPLCWILTKKIKGMENIPDKKTFIVAANHETNRDHLLIIYPVVKKLDKKVHFIATPVWWLNKFSRQWAGVIPMHSPKQAYREAKEAIKSGEIVGIFPEGRLERKKRTENPKTGAVRLALETGTPILPIGIKFSWAPFSSTINIGKLIYLNKNKGIKKQSYDVMKYLYKLKNNPV